MGDILF